MPMLKGTREAAHRDADVADGDYFCDEGGVADRVGAAANEDAPDHGTNWGDENCQNHDDRSDHATDDVWLDWATRH